MALDSALPYQRSFRITAGPIISWRRASSASLLNDIASCHTCDDTEHYTVWAGAFADVHATVSRSGPRRAGRRRAYGDTSHEAVARTHPSNFRPTRARTDRILGRDASRSRPRAEGAGESARRRSLRTSTPQRRSPTRAASDEGDVDAPRCGRDTKSDEKGTRTARAGDVVIRPECTDA